jgi:hypothetical protein
MKKKKDKSPYFRVPHADVKVSSVSWKVLPRQPSDEAAGISPYDEFSRLVQTRREGYPPYQKDTK